MEDIAFRVLYDGRIRFAEDGFRLLFPAAREKPVQKGINSVGSWLSGLTSNFSDASALREENEALQERVDQLTAENSQLVLDQENICVVGSEAAIEQNRNILKQVEPLVS